MDALAADLRHVCVWTMWMLVTYAFVELGILDVHLWSTTPWIMAADLGLLWVLVGYGELNGTSNFVAASAFCLYLAHRHTVQ